jgi:hypothetical protein
MCESVADSPCYADKPFADAAMNEALNSCFDKNLLQIMSAATVDLIRDTLAEAGSPLPLDGLPLPGMVDFTDAGASVFKAIARSRDDLMAKPSNVPAVELVVSRKTLYFRDEQRAAEAHARLNSDQRNGKIGDIERIGRWCVNWREVWPEGFRFEIDDYD